MRETRRMKWTVLAAALAALYALPHSGDQPNLIVGAGFTAVALAMGWVFHGRRPATHLLSYAAISGATYYALFQNQPWETLLSWVPDEMGFSLVVLICSTAMSYAGGLLLADAPARAQYVKTTLTIQGPIALLAACDPFKELLTLLGKALWYRDPHMGWALAWQFLWLATYAAAFARGRHRRAE